jgi:K+/H+ antiporter YhaU regulatory subunit KhtT
LVGRTLADVNLRATTGASVVALLHDKELTANPKSNTHFHAGDVVALIGDAQQIAAAEQVISAEPVAAT